MTLFLLKPKVQKKLKEPCEKTVVSPKTKKVIKNEEPSEEQLGAPKPKKGVRQGCILSPCLFNFYAECIMRNAGLEETQARSEERRVGKECSG